MKIGVLKAEKLFLRRISLKVGQRGSCYFSMLWALQELMGLHSMKAAPRASGDRTKVIWINTKYAPWSYYSLKC